MPVADMRPFNFDPEPALKLAMRGTIDTALLKQGRPLTHGLRLINPVSIRSCEVGWAVQIAAQYLQFVYLAGASAPHWSWGNTGI